MGRWEDESQGPRLSNGRPGDLASTKVQRTLDILSEVVLSCYSYLRCLYVASGCSTHCAISSSTRSCLARDRYIYFEIPVISNICLANSVSDERSLEQCLSCCSSCRSTCASSTSDP
jgi:hypothetical protein